MSKNSDDFDFKFCPECGCPVKPTRWIVAAGQYKKCTDCGKEWHVTWDNFEEWKDKENENNQT